MSRALFITHHRAYKTRLPWRTEGVARAWLELDPQNEAVILCTADRAKFGFKFHPEERLTWVEAPDLLAGRLRSGWDPWSRFRRTRWLRDQSFDLIFAFESRPAVIHPVLAKLEQSPCPLIMDWADWWGHGGLATENRPSWYPRAARNFETHYEEAYRTRADATVVISRGLQPRAIELGVAAESIVWLPNGCEPDRIEPFAPEANRARFGLAPAAFLVGFNASDVTLGFETVAEATRLLRRRLPHAQLITTGRGFAATAPDGRHFGFLPDDDFVALLSCMDAFVVPFPDCPANRGRWPGRINDYLSAGRPIISQPAGEMGRLLENEAVGTACEFEPQALADALQSLAEDPAHRNALGQNARELATGKLNWSALSSRLESAVNIARSRFAQRQSPA